MKTRRTSLKIFIAAMMAVVLMASFALTTFADSDDNMHITYYGNGYAITNESLLVYDANQNAIGLVMFNFVQTGPNTSYIEYKISIINGTASDLMTCSIIRWDTITNLSNQETPFNLESAYCSGTNGELRNGLGSVYFDELTKEITANLTIFKYNTSSSLLEEYSVQFTLSFGYIISYPYIVYTVSSANYEYR